MFESDLPHSEHVNEIVGTNIQRARLNRGLTVEALSELTSLPVERLNGYEDGSQGIMLSDLYAIAKAMKAPLTAIFKGEEAMVEGN